MSITPVLDATRAPLAGVNLVEANAGTGKTYSIVSLYLRLVVERGLSVDRILVVSFTEAATAELRTRIRERLAALRDALENDTCEDPFMAALARRLDDRPLAIRQLTRALQSFDEAAIHTIHGFCQRLLADAGFETGAVGEVELEPDDSTLRRQVIDDFWRARTAQGTALWLAWLAGKSSPARLAQQLADYMARPALVRLAPDPGRIDAGLETRVCEASLSLQREWRRHREELVRLLHSEALNKNSYSTAIVNKLAQSADDWARCAPALAPLQRLERLGTTTITRRTKANRQAPSHPFFDAFQDLLDAARELEAGFEARLARWRYELLEEAAVELPQRKRERRLRSFDDLLNDVYAAVERDVTALRRSLRYDAALIDEFQDTDPVQFAIFERLFADHDTAVYLVGDPKQAIYSFRGADVYTYLDARERADECARLTDNYRSTPQLVEAVNALFTRARAPFELADIHYAPSRAARDIVGLREDGRDLPALRLWQIGGDGDRLRASQARTLVAAATATEIVRLLSLARDKRLTKNGDQPLEARDIAVLVRTHEEGDAVRAALTQRGVASIQRTEQSVFATPMAADLAVVLRAVARPSNVRAVRAALATDLLGYDAQAIVDLEGNEARWQELLDLFAAHNEQWRLGGYAPMQRGLMREFAVERRLLGWRDGRRYLTDLLHLEDLLQHEASARKLNPDELLLWMQAQRVRERHAEQALLRLESDENLVRIVTIHYAKGLQFPVVFAPFLYAPPRVHDELAVFHDDRRRQVLDCGSDRFEQHRELQKLEQRAESLRLAYVALTRAELHCVTAWGNVTNAARSPLAWLTHSRAGDNAEELARRLESQDQAAWFEPLRELTPALAVAPLPAPGEQVLTGDDRPTPLAARAPEPRPRAGWRVASFSAVARAQVEQPRDYDALVARPAADVAAPADIFGFPRGARAGRALHTLFERIDFAADAADIEPVAAAVLREHGYDHAAAPVVAQMAHDVLNTALDERGRLYLRGLAPAQRQPEMEFYFPTAPLDADALREALAGFGADGPVAARLAALEFSLAPGFMHGFIDLVFTQADRYYVADYKSNWLGGSLDAYARELLPAEIARHDYYLQYLIYSLAVHRHLRATVRDYDYERHFGGVYYLFLRGMRPGTGPASGVYYDRPSFGHVDRLERALCLPGQT